MTEVFHMLISMQHHRLNGVGNADLRFTLDLTELPEVPKRVPMILTPHAFENKGNQLLCNRNRTSEAGEQMSSPGKRSGSRSGFSWVSATTSVLEELFVTHVAVLDQTFKTCGEGTNQEPTINL